MGQNFCIDYGCDPENMVNLRAALVTDSAKIPKNLLYQIRFNRMSFKEIIKVCYKSYKDIFSNDEIDEILYIFAKEFDSPLKCFSYELSDIPENNTIESNRIIFDTSLAANIHFDVVFCSCNIHMLLDIVGCSINGKKIYNSTETLTFGANEGASVKLKSPILIKSGSVDQIRINLKEKISVKKM